MDGCACETSVSVDHWAVICRHGSMENGTFRTDFHGQISFPVPLLSHQDITQVARCQSARSEFCVLASASMLQAAQKLGKIVILHTSIDDMLPVAAPLAITTLEAT